MIQNKTRKKILAKHLRYCNTMFQKGSGLMFRNKKSVEDTGWVFNFINPRKISITMMFVRFPIDIIFLDKNLKIIDLIENLRPWSFYNSEELCLKCIELESGTIKKTGTKIGDVILIEE